MPASWASGRVFNLSHPPEASHATLLAAPSSAAALLDGLFARFEPHSRVLCAGTESADWVAALQRRGVSDILLACGSQPEAQRALEHNGPVAPSSLGNDRQLRCWEGSLATVPAYQGPADLIIVVDGIENARAQLLAGSLLLKPGGHLLWAVPSSAAGAGFASTDAVHAAGKGLPMRLAALGCHHALFQVPEGYALSSGPLAIRGSVISGHGRGSRQLGFPTANIDPATLPKAFHALALGVYFGWARVDNGTAIHPAVMNVGKSPTFEDADPKLSVETHIMHAFDRDFYGKELHVVILGYLRPELKFSGLDALVARIEKDVGLARTQLASPRWLECQAHVADGR